MNNDVLLEVKNLTAEILGHKNNLKVVDNISFSVKAGEIIGLVGESGCGKTVTSLSIMGLIKFSNGQVSGGQVLMHGRDLLSCSEEELRVARGKEISMIFQEPMMALNPVLRIETQMLESLMLHVDISKNEAQKKILRILSNVGIPNPEVTAYCFPHQLSGGMCQRVMIAMAMSCNPHLLIADEPTTALDVTIQAQILELMRDIRNKFNTGIILITHDLGIVAEMCNRVLVMYAGRIVEEASVEELFESPKHPYTQGLMASVPVLGSGIRSLPYIDGNVPDISNLPSGCKFSPSCKYAFDKCRTEEPVLINLGIDRKYRCWLESI